MASFGGRLRAEREARHTTIEQVAKATGIKLEYLEALEGDAFDHLPGRAFGKLYIRAYAATLGFDPRELIEHYDRERAPKSPPPDERRAPESAEPHRVESAIARWRRDSIARRGEAEMSAAPAGTLRGSTEAPREGPAVVAGEGLTALPGMAAFTVVAGAGAMEARASSRPWRPVVLALLVVVLAVVAGVRLGRREDPSATPDAIPARPHGDTLAAAAPLVSAPDPDPAPRPPPPPSEPSAAPAPRHAARETRRPQSPLRVEESAVGRWIAARRLAEPGERFTQGEVAWFSTRVLGGEPGRRIRHVWIHEGRALQSIALDLGGPDWRTQSRKTLREAGAWSVEARDEEGRVLARADLDCDPIDGLR